MAGLGIGAPVHYIYPRPITKTPFMSSTVVLRNSDPNLIQFKVKARGSDDLEDIVIRVFKPDHLPGFEAMDLVITINEIKQVFESDRIAGQIRLLAQFNVESYDDLTPEQQSLFIAEYGKLPSSKKMHFEVYKCLVDKLLAKEYPGIDFTNPMFPYTEIAKRYLEVYKEAYSDFLVEDQSHGEKPMVQAKAKAKSKK